MCLGCAVRNQHDCLVALTSQTGLVVLCECKQRGKRDGERERENNVEKMEIVDNVIHSDFMLFIPDVESRKRIQILM